MKIRAKSNGNVIDTSDEEGQRLVDAGIYEVVEDEVVEDEDAAKEPAKPTKQQGSYKRRDMAAE